MAEIIRFFAVFVSGFLRDRADLVAENLVLRQQLTCLARGRRRPQLRPIERYGWGLLSQHWARWRELWA